MCASIVTAVACTGDDGERFPPANQDSNSNARIFGGGASGRMLGVDAGSPRGPSEDPNEAVQVRGVVAVAITADLQTVVDLAVGPVDVAVSGAEGGIDAAEYLPGSAFELSAKGLPVLLAVQPRDPQLGLLTTLQWVHDPAAETVALVLNRVALDGLLDSFSSGQSSLEPNRAHAILNFLDDRGTPQSGVTISAGDAIVGYDQGPAYSDVQGATADRGSAVLINVPAAATGFPGATQLIGIEQDGTVTELELHLAAGAVTLANILL